MTDKQIHIKGARVNNLKNIDLKIPRDKLVVITGVSGSGKSSLAFDTLFAEGQRRFAESLSSFARQFLGRMNKPAVDYITGIPPAIAIGQHVHSRNSRSTVGSSSEINDYLRLLYAKIGKTYSPISGKEVTCDTPKSVSDHIIAQGEGNTVLILADIRWREEGQVEKHRCQGVPEKRVRNPQSAQEPLGAGAIIVTGISGRRCGGPPRRG